MGDTHGQYYLNLHVEDRPGVLAEIAEAFGRHGVSIERVWQEGFGEEAALVFITHRAQEAPFQETVAELRGRDSVRAVVEPAPGGGRGVSEVRRGAHQWRGLIEEYRERLPVTDATPVITLREGGTPLVRSENLSARTGAEVWLKYDGANPTGSFKDRGMTLAISKAVEEGAEAVVCASTGNTSASAAAYAAKAGLTCAVLVPKGKVALGKMAATLVHGARMLEVEGNFDASFDLASDLAARYPVTLVNSVNPFRLQGQKTAAFEICDMLGRAPDIHCVPVGNAGNISSHWLGYSEYLADGMIAEPPQLFGFQAAGAAPLVTGEPVADPQTIATAIRIGNPASWDLAHRGRARLRGRHLVGHRPPDPRRLPDGRSRRALRRAGERGQRRGPPPGARGRPRARGRDRRVHPHRARAEGPGVGDRRRRASRDRARRRGDRRRGTRSHLVVAIGSARHARLRVRARDLGQPRPGVRHVRPGSRHPQRRHDRHGGRTAA